MGTSTRKTKAAPQPEPSANKSELKRQLADQLKTVFIAGLTLLWVTTLESVPKRPPCLPWLITSIVVFIVVFFWFACKRKKVRWPKLWWVFPFAAVALFWLMYCLSGVSFPIGLPIGFAIFMLTWATFLLLALGLVTIRWEVEGKLGKTITWVVKQGDYFYWMLSVFVLLISVLRGWRTLWDAGMRGWWMTWLLLGGVLVFIVVGLVYSFTSRSGSKRN